MSSQEATPQLHTSDADILAIYAAVTAKFKSGDTKPLEARRTHLRALERLFVEHERDICEAAWKDLGREYGSTLQYELSLVLLEIRLALKNLNKWSAGKSMSVPLPFITDGCRITPQPLGTVFIISSWNYPSQVAFIPLIGAIAAGNTAIVKMSEVAPHTASLFSRLLPKYIPEDVVCLVDGAIPETTTLLSLPFNHIFFTGSGTVGKIVMAAAAKHLTPVTLELGGKCPVIIDADADLAMAARRITWAKTGNAGQSCIAPDYIICPKDQIPELIRHMDATLVDFFGPEKLMQRVVNKNHYNRLTTLLKDTKGEILLGREGPSPDTLTIPLTVVGGMTPGDILMQEEIFGPILPILPVENLDEAIDYVNSRPHPLALSVFGPSAAVKRVMAETISGTCSGNEIFMQMAIANFPFGGVGASGTGAYHGINSFRTFSHYKPTIHRFQGLDWLVSFRYPATTVRKLQFLWFVLFYRWRSASDVRATLGADAQ